MANGTRSGTSYVHDSYGRYYMLIRSTDLESYTITIEQNTDYVPEPQPQIMSFEEAIEATKTNNYDDSPRSYVLYNEFKGDAFTGENGVFGYLMWLAPNGTLYQAEYPSGTPLSWLGYTYSKSSWNAPEGYYLWWLKFSDGETFWVLSGNGTIVEHYFGRGDVPSPTPQPFPTEFAYAITAAAAVAALVSVTVLLYFKKRE